MDSVTQILLAGATVAELAIGKAIGRRAALYGLSRFWARCRTST
jgi:pyridoxine 5'-phosphate synthase PdxJ